jgi:glycosyltransferase involved in cell wall biosynthesis
MHVSVLTIRDEKFVLFLPQDSEKGFQEMLILKEIDNGRIAQNYYSRNARKAVEIAVSQSNPDIIHIHGLHQYFTLSTAVYLKTLRIPVVLTMHDYKALCGNAGFFSDRTEEVCLKCLEGRSTPPIRERCKKNSYILSTATSAQMLMWNLWEGLDAIDCFHCGSDFVYQLLSKNPRTREKRAKVRFPYFRPARHRESAQTDSLRIVYSGRMVPHKGPTIFARAIAGIDSIPVHIFGDGPLFSETKELTKEMKNVTMHGWKTHEEIQGQLGPGSVVVVPYLANETFCYVVLEAMAGGCCVVASARGAIPEFIKNGVNGLLVDNPTPEAFRTSIQSLLDSPAKIRSLGENATNITKEVPTLEDHAAAMLNLYLTIRDGKRS